jgi:DNA-binding transcriptional LysR family regulator
MSKHRVAKWLNDVAPDARIVARSNSVLGLMYAVKSGVGALPTAIADSEPDLVRVLGPIPKLARCWWVLTHPDLRHIPRIVALFFDFVVEEHKALKSILTG